MLVREVADAAVEVALHARRVEEAFEFVTGLAVERHDRAVREDGRDREHLVRGLAVADGVRSAGVVADAPSDGGAVLGRGVDGVVEAERTRLLAEPVQDHAGLDAGGPRLGVELQNLGHVPREVEDHGVVHALAREARPGPSREHGDPALGRNAHDVADVLGGAGEHDRDGLHLVDGGVGGVEQA